MIVTPLHGEKPALFADLFGESFAASEGPAEGLTIRRLVDDLLTETPPDDIRAFRAETDGRTVAGVVFSRLRYPDDDRRVMLLSPMAVAPDRQRQGIGRALIDQAISSLRSEGVDLVITYGDPAFYTRAGFVQITERQARPPLPLSMPQGWLGRPLLSDAMPHLRGPSYCVPALHRPDLW